jgi:hypothetical protein
MPRNLENEENEILNGSRFLNSTQEHTGVLHRDVDKLFVQYENLRQRVYTTYKDYLPDYTTQMELRSYIDEQFVRLVKEYEINGEVDFPGYIKTKLNQRVKHSFIQGEYRDRQRVFTTRNDTDISSLMDLTPMEDEELDYYEVLSYVFDGLELTEIERSAIFHILQEKTNTQITWELVKDYPDFTRTQITETMKKMQSLLKSKLEESLRNRSL